MTSSRIKQQGVALIIVLLIVAIVSVIATEMGTRLQLQIKRASNIKENNQAFWYAMAAEQYAQKSLKLLFKNDGDVIHLNQEWNQEFVFPIEGGGIKAQLIDMQACFNLNALGVTGKRAGSTGQVTGPNAGTTGNSSKDSANKISGQKSTTGQTELLPERITAFEKLLSGIDAEIPSYNVEILRDSLADWLDQDGRARQLGAEDSEYESRQFPYSAANNLMVHKSEIRLVNGVEVKWLDKLLDVVCVIPNDPIFEINVNTVEEENAIIISALTGLDNSQAQSVISARGEDGYKKATDFLNTPEIKALNLTDNQKAWFAVNTSHFILRTQTQYNNASFAMQTVFKIDKSKNVSVIRREFSGF